MEITCKSDLPIPMKIIYIYNPLKTKKSRGFTRLLEITLLSVAWIFIAPPWDWRIKLFHQVAKNRI